MNGQLSVVLCLGAMLAMVAPALASPVRTDDSGRVVITHSMGSLHKVADGSGVSSGSGSGDDFDFDLEDPSIDDEDADCDNSTTTSPEGSGAQGEVTEQPEGSGEEELTTQAAGTTAESTTVTDKPTTTVTDKPTTSVTDKPTTTVTDKPTTTVTDKPESFKCPATYKNHHYLFPVPGDCNAFYQCDTVGKHWVKKCPAGLAFHNDYQVCVRPEAYGLC